MSADPVILSPDEAMLFQSFLAMAESLMPRDTETPFARFARERLWIKTKEGKVIEFNVNAVQRRYLARKRLAYMQSRPRRFLLLKYRRGGFTTLEQGITYKLVTTKRNQTAVTLSSVAEKTMQVFRIAKLFHKMDPNAPPIKGRGSSYDLDFPTLNSHFYIGTAASRGFGRGDTLQRVHWSEVAFSCLGGDQVTKQRDVLTGITEAASHGEVVLETTANGGELFKQLYQGAKRGENEWTPIFLAWFDDNTNRLPLENEDEARAIVASYTDEEKEIVERHHLDAGQIKWRRSKKKELGALFDQEYPEDDETCFRYAGVLFFDAQLVNRLLTTIPEVPRKHVEGGYTIEWEPPKRGVRYIAASDTSEGLPDGDRAGMGIIREDTGAQVFAFHGALDVNQQAKMGAEHCTRYNGALWAIERNNTSGGAVIAKAQELKYRNLYEFTKGRDGFSTDSVTRPLILNKIRDVMTDHPELIRDRDFLAECFNMKRRPDGTYGGVGDEHDDTVFKWAIAYYVRGTAPPRPRISVI